MTEQILERLFIEVLNMSLTGSVIILAVLLARSVLKKAPRILSYMLWLVVLFRLLCPFSFESGFSLLGALQNESASEGRMEYIPENIGYQMEPKVTLPVPVMNDAVNHSLPAGNPAGSVNPLQIVLYLTVRIWILGILMMFVYNCVSGLRLKRRLKSGVRERDNIYRLPGSGSPFVYGFFRPKIYLPENLTRKEEKYMLLHEQIHIRRGDHIYRLLAFLALCLHWFNPFVWIAFSFSGRDMEISCDEAVVRKLGSRIKKEYSASLLNLSCGSRVVKGTPLAFGESDTGNRIKHILRYKKPARIFAGISVVICVIFAAALLANPEKKEEIFSCYGIVSYAKIEGLPQMVVNIPGSGGVLIPQAEEIYPYMETEFDGLEEGDLIKITFPPGLEVLIQETYPGKFTEDPESIVVMGRGFAMDYEGSDIFRFAMPLGLVTEAEEGDTLEIYHHDPAIAEEETIRLASMEILSVDKEKNHLWVEMKRDVVETFLAEFGFGIYFKAVPHAEENDRSETSVIPLTFMAYFPHGAEVTDSEEFEALKDSDNWFFGNKVTLESMPVPIHKYSVEDIKTVLAGYAGISVSDLKNKDNLSELIFLPEYDDYYNFTSDAGFVGCPSENSSNSFFYGLKFYKKMLT